MPHSTSGIGNVAFVAWDNVKMEVEDGLTCCRAFVESDVEAVWMEALGDQPLALIDCRPDCSFLGGA